TDRRRFPHCAQEDSSPQACGGRLFRRLFDLTGAALRLRLHSRLGVEIVDAGLSAHLVLLGRARAHTDTGDDLAVDPNRQPAADDAEMAFIADMDAEGRFSRNA